MDESESKEQLNRELAAWLADMREGANFLSDQAPDVVRDLIVMGRVEATASMSFSALFLAAAVLLIWRLSRGWLLIPRAEPEFSWAATCLLAVFSALFSVMIFMESARRFLVVWFAPKLYILDYVGALVSGGGR